MPMEYNLMLGGVLLLLLECAMPGFGVCGIAGLGALSAGGFILLGGGLYAVAVLGAIYAVLAAVLLLCIFYVPTAKKWQRLILWDKQTGEEGYRAPADLSALLHAHAVAVTPLHPAGTVLLDGRRVDVSSLGDYIDKGAEVQVVRIEGSKIFVQEAKGVEKDV